MELWERAYEVVLEGGCAVINALLHPLGRVVGGIAFACLMWALTMLLIQQAGRATVEAVQRPSAFQQSHHQH